MSMIDDIRARVHGYWTGAPVPADELPKHKLVRDLCELANDAGLTEAEIDEWARYQQGEPTVGVVSAQALIELARRLKRPGGVGRFRARLARDRAKREGKA